MSKKVLSLGQCAADNYAIRRFLEDQFQAEVIAADTFQEARIKLSAEPFALVLVNRVFERDGASGLTFIGDIRRDETLTEIPVMLVSNFADAQKQAIALGAAPGFGKAALSDPKTAERLRPILGG